METRQETATFAGMGLGDFVERLASAEPVPGGGAASAVAAALGAALVSMVAGLSTGRSKYAAYEATLARADASGRRLAAELLELADRDADAYGSYAVALKLPRENEEQVQKRQEAIRAAAKVASEAPWETVRACHGVALEAESLAGRSNVNASSDVLVAALLAQAAAKGAAENVRINLPSTGDPDYSIAMARRLDEVLHDIEALAAQTRETVLSGQVRDPEPG